MKAIVCKNNQIKMVEKPLPQLMLDTDAIVEVKASSICTSDLHIIKGCVPFSKDGVVLGHEFAGMVVEVGSAVRGFKKGDRVAVNCETFCGECFFCKRSSINNCENGGWMLGCRIDGAQAQYVRVPYASNGLTKLPDNVSCKDALFVGDILSSGYWGAELCEIKGGETVAVIGLGPVGLCAAQCAGYLGAKKVTGIDINPKRLELGSRLGFIDETINPKTDELPQNFDCVIECAGSEDSFKMAYTIARPAAIVAIVAMYEKDQVLPLPKMYGKNLTFKTGGVDATRCRELVELISKGKLTTNFLITHEFKFDDILEAYRVFENKENDCLKVMIEY